MRTFTKAELRRYNGQNGAPAYIAYQGNVYDVSHSFLWQQGKHQVVHFAGADLTESLDHEAPHGPELLERVPIIGILIEEHEHSHNTT
jgi:predicted heme/steroid binding protein